MADDWQGLPFDAEHDEPRPTRRPLSVSEISARLKTAVESAFTGLLVEGEISNCRRWSSGHLYFTLKDDYAQLRAVMFRSTVRTLRFAPEDGMHVVARGRLGVYEVKGEYQLVCDALEPQGRGALQAAFEQLKRRLQAEGLFDVGRKRPLPVLPRRIGVVTSLDGAAIRDILRVITVRHPSARVVVRPARVQGEGAARELARALSALARVPDVEVIIIGRGGGSIEDLWAFNDETLARAIAASPVPVIAAIGHESDVTIADLVADRRAATPSNAAEIVVERADHFSARIDRAGRSLHRIMAATRDAAARTAERLDLRLGRWPVSVVMRQRDLEESRLRLLHAAGRHVDRRRDRFDTLRRRLERRDLRRVAAELGARVEASAQRLTHAMHAGGLARTARLGAAAGRLDALSPLGVLGRGYALCWDASRTRIIRAAGAVQPGDQVRITLADGELGCRVDETS